MKSIGHMIHRAKGRAGAVITFFLGVALAPVLASASDFYADPSGQDGGGNDGSPSKPWKTVGYAITQASAGDTIHLTPGATFTGRVYVASGSGGTAGAPKVITSDPGNRAIIEPGSNTEEALYVYNAAGLRFEHLRFVGQGMDTHDRDGVSCYADDGRHAGLEFIDCQFTGFGKQGLVIGGWGGTDHGFANVLVMDCTAHDNRTGGILTYGEYASANTNVTIRSCIAYRNLGDAEATSHTGSGIILGGVTDGLVERCIAYENGERCDTTGGPLGIWTYQSTRVVIQYCEAYSNRAAVCDGGGFDIDGGAQDCVIQYCYSHDNDGPGYLICQYAGARAFTSNTVRYCISENDGRRQTGTRHGGIHFWSSGSSGGLQDTHIYGNTVFGSYAPAVWFQNTGGQSGTMLWNNILVTTGGQVLVQGSPAPMVAQFQNNCYWSSGGAFSVAGYASLDTWRVNKDQERLGTIDTGYELDPRLTDPGQGGTIGIATQLHTLAAYQLLPTSALIDRALDLSLRFGIDTGGQDFYSHALPQCRGYDVGAHESPDADDDGLPDDWEVAYFGNTTTADETSHGDNDNQCDRDEFVAGTNPTNALSCFALTGLTVPVQTQCVLRWSSTAGRQYAVDWSTDLLKAFTNEAGSGIPATPPLNTHTCTLDNGSIQYYRVRMER
jgi:Right handed beta helix region